MTGARDWAATLLGLVEGRPHALRRAVGIVLGTPVSSFPRMVAWAGRSLDALQRRVSTGPRREGVGTACRVWLGSGATVVPDIEVRVVVENALSTPPEQLPKLFELFVGPRAPQNWPCVGRVYITRAIVTAHGGKIDVDSAEGCTPGPRVTAARRTATKRSNDAEFRSHLV